MPFLDEETQAKKLRNLPIFVQPSGRARIQTQAVTLESLLLTIILYSLYSAFSVLFFFEGV